MSVTSSPRKVAARLLAERKLHLESSRILQSLWAGYGQICFLETTPDSSPNTSTASSRSVSAVNSNVVTPTKKQTYILKFISPPSSKTNDEGHTRKILSYQIEQYFYSQLAPQLPPSIPVADCIASVNDHHGDGTSTTAMILTNLKERFPVAGEKQSVLSPTQVNAAIDWLSGFHGFWWTRVERFDRRLLVLPPLDEVRVDEQDAHDKTVWLNGGYTYLATRRKEYKDLIADTDSEWSDTLTHPVNGGNGLSVAELVAKLLAGHPPYSAYETLIHGDVKSENLFTNQRGDKVAFYDFQYTGLGFGVCDLAKLFTCSMPSDMLVSNKHSIPNQLPMQEGEKKLLERYLARLRDVSGRSYEWQMFVFHWEIALVDWLRFQASWGFWGNTEWLEARVRSIVNDQGWRDSLVYETWRT